MESLELDCTVQLITAAGKTFPVSAHLSYYSWDPYAVHITFSTQGRSPVSWTFARDLLGDGMVRASGSGDVQIFPGAPEQPGSLYVALSSPNGYALLIAPMATVAPWLNRSYEIVPAGLEGASIDLDATLSRLLGEDA